MNGSLPEFNIFQTSVGEEEWVNCAETYCLGRFFAHGSGEAGHVRDFADLGVFNVRFHPWVNISNPRRYQKLVLFVDALEII